ncbi:hypothetical protein C7N43_06160 [Sphingobacteriales bacterium UPWRP_1]|nr:hypothetical protein BVG80_11840 [Sphingobacteriales bacterium TSM_CSM]PSJ77917.1 hypothetical protein C7N43_06160 [Sphingobacteriales bacterium UPWRP_1]
MPAVAAFVNISVKTVICHVAKSKIAVSFYQVAVTTTFKGKSLGINLFEKVKKQKKRTFEG